MQFQESANQNLSSSKTTIKSQRKFTYFDLFRYSSVLVWFLVLVGIIVKNSRCSPSPRSLVPHHQLLSVINHRQLQSTVSTIRPSKPSHQPPIKCVQSPRCSCSSPSSWPASQQPSSSVLIPTLCRHSRRSRPSRPRTGTLRHQWSRRSRRRLLPVQARLMVRTRCFLFLPSFFLLNRFMLLMIPSVPSLGHDFYGLCDGYRDGHAADD